MGERRWRMARTDDVLAEVAAHVEPLSLLSAPERDRYDRLRQAVDRQDFLGARVLARLVLLDIPAGAVRGPALQDVRFAQRCTACGGPHGRPMVVGGELEVSWAHAKGVVAAAVSDRVIGIDVERTAGDPPPLPGIEGGRAWLTWTRIEAVTKLGLADLDTAMSWAPRLDHAPGDDVRVALPAGDVRLTDEVDAGVVTSIAQFAD